jgi:hypothetical protein
MRAASTFAVVTATAAAAVLFGTLGNADAGSSNGHRAPRQSHSTSVPLHTPSTTRHVP